jgi:hypothetical protein
MQTQKSTLGVAKEVIQWGIAFPLTQVFGEPWNHTFFFFSLFLCGK